ncbi:MAG: hypothetical protein HRT94_02475 [Alphaproteobacteria bacterium]|nr:hypothetical protein [Alphaproteobacteria bacterium]
MISTWRSSISTFLNKPLTYCLIIAGLTIPTSLWAQEPVFFKEPETTKEKRAISFIKKDTQSTDNKYKIAKTDLNTDSLNEYIVKPQECRSGTMCTHYVIAFMEGLPIELLSIKARKITIDTQDQYGVKNLFIYGHETNDFKKTPYFWTPGSFSYKQNLGVNTR